MPKLVKIIELYTCDFKCGTKAKEKNKMIQHEENCFCNPINQSCRICENCESGKYNMSCNELKLSIINHEKPHKVYDFDDKVVWEEKQYPEEAWNYNNQSEFDEISKHNKSRPFPTKNCAHFVLGKKRF